jgi:hypothetical protein
MNERIQELAEQAGIFKPKEFYQHIDPLQLEKFAELIVRECIDIVPWLYEAKIKEHFGVEE